MESTPQHTKTGLVKHHLNRFKHSHEFMLELSLITTILVCLNFWTHLPDLGIDPIWGRGVAAIGILIIICMVAFRFKWPILLVLAGMVVYLGISHLRTDQNNMVKQGDGSTQPFNNHSSGVSTYFMPTDSVK